MPGKHIGNLQSVKEVTCEYRRVYREARNEKMDMKRAKGLAWMLKELSHMIRVHDLEERLEALENAANNE